MVQPTPTPTPTPIPLAVIFGQNVRRERYMRAWSQATLATYAGLSTPTVSHIETGKHHGMLLTTAAALATALRLPLDTLLTPVPRPSCLGRGGGTRDLHPPPSE